MKKLFLFLFAALFAFSCSKNDAFNEEFVPEGRFTILVNDQVWVNVNSTDKAFISEDISTGGEPYYHLSLKSNKAHLMYDFHELKEGDTERAGWAKLMLDHSELGDNAFCPESELPFSNQYLVTIRSTGNMIDGAGCGFIKCGGDLVKMDFLFNVPMR